MPNIITEILKQIPDSDKKISDSVFEGANIILYTKDKEFLMDNNELIRGIVSVIKKRIEIRADPDITMPTEKAEELIRKKLPEDSKIANILFDQQRSIVVVEAERPGAAIGKQGELLREL